MNRQVETGGVTARVWRRDEYGVRPLLHGVLVLLVTGLAASPVHAAVQSASHHGSHALPISLALVALGGLGLMAATRHGRKAALVALVLLVALFGVETAVHSVHHFSDPQAAASCALLSASQHAPGACAATLDLGAPIWTGEPSPAVETGTARSLQAFGPPEGRAPPSLPSA